MNTGFQRGKRDHVLWKEVNGHRMYWVAEDNPDTGVWAQQAPFDSDYHFKGTEEVHAFVDRMALPGTYYTTTVDELIDDSLYQIPANINVIVKE